jgi:EF hand
MTMRSAVWPVGIALILAVGCSSRPGAIRPPSVDPDDAAGGAIEKYDRNGDGALSKDEWSDAPELVAVATQHDTTGDGALSADEIAEGIRIWQEGPVGARAVSFKITFNGRPLPGATVRLVPAEYLGEGVKAASGESGPDGSGKLRVAAEDLPKNAPNMALMQPGLYRVEITHPSVKIPEKYNAKTTLGIEVSGSNPGPQGITWALSTK